MFTLRLVVDGQAVEPTEHESFTDLSEVLAEELGADGMGLKPRSISVLLSVMYSDLRTHVTWSWVADDYQIFVARDSR